jgi:Zn-dependent metalloprotease
MTGKVRFIGAEFSRAIAQPTILGAKATPETAARGFLSTYGSLFGIKDQARELKVMRSKKVDRGRSFVRFQQRHSDVPILGGELIIQTDSFNNILSANGEIIPEIRVNTSPH